MDTRWLDDEQRDAWVRLVAVVELLPGVLDSQLRRDAGLTHFEYFVLAMLSEAPERTLRMTRARPAHQRHAAAALPRRPPAGGPRAGGAFPCPEDGRATNARLTDAGWDAVVAAAPGTSRPCAATSSTRCTPEQSSSCAASPTRCWRLDPDGRMTALRPGAVRE